MTYELACVLDGNLTKEAIDELVGKIKEELRDEAKLLSEELWERRRLAYRISGQAYAYHAFLYMNIEPTEIKTVQEKLTHTPHVLRFLISKQEVLPELKPRTPKVESKEATPVVKEEAPATVETPAEAPAAEEKPKKKVVARKTKVEKAEPTDEAEQEAEVAETANEVAPEQAEQEPEKTEKEEPKAKKTTKKEPKKGLSADLDNDDARIRELDKKLDELLKD